MSAAPVDVLAALNFHIANLTGDRNRARRLELGEVRAAVAELIEAAGELLQDTQHVNHHCGDSACPVTRTRAALAACGGAK